MSISFFTPVTYGLFSNSSVNKLLEISDDYLNILNRKKVQFIPGYQQGKSEGVVPTDNKSQQTALRIASYFTVIIPLIALTAKIILRSIYKFHLIKNPQIYTVTSGNSDSSNNPPPPPPELKLSLSSSFSVIEFDKELKLSCEEVSQLYLKAVTELGTVPDGSHFNVCQKGFSDLPEYSDSFFLFKYEEGGRYWNEGKYLITRKKIQDQFKRSYPYIPLNTVTTLTVSDFKALSLDSSRHVSSDGSLSAFSHHSEYKGSQFTWKEKDLKHVVIIRS